MPVLGRPTLKRYFETGKGLSNQAFVALIDSIPNLANTTAQDFVSPISTPELIGQRVSAGNFYTVNLLASTATFSGIVRHGLRGATSAADTLGFPIVRQAGTAAASATTQFAFLPRGSQILGMGIDVLRASSAAAGGTTLSIGTNTTIDYFAPTAVVSGAGKYVTQAVCARRLTDVSGGLSVVAPTATAGAVFLPWVEYYVTVEGGGASLAAPTTSYTNDGGQGDRTASITVTISTTNAWLANGAASNFVDGGIGANSTDSVGDGNQAMTDGDRITFDFGAKKYIDEVTINTNTLPANGAWQFQGSDDDSNYTSYASTTWNVATQAISVVGVPPQGHRYWRWRKDGTAGSATNTWYREFTFQIAAGAT